MLKFSQDLANNMQIIIKTSQISDALALFNTLAATVDAGFVGDVFEMVDLGTLSLSDTVVVFGFVKVVERTVDETGADLTRDAVDDTVEVTVLVAPTFGAAVVLGAALVTVLKKTKTAIKIRKFVQKINFPNNSLLIHWQKARKTYLALNGTRGTVVRGAVVLVAGFGALVRVARIGKIKLCNDLRIDWQKSRIYRL